MSAIIGSLDAMKSSSKRVKVHNAQTVVKHPAAIKELVNTIAEKNETSESAIWREALGEWLAKRGYDR